MSVLWLRQRDTGYTHINLLFSLWQRLRCFPAACQCHTGANPSKPAGQQSDRDDRRGLIITHPSPHVHVKTQKNMQVHRYTVINTHRHAHPRPRHIHRRGCTHDQTHRYTQRALYSDSTSRFLDIWSSQLRRVEMREAELMETMFHSLSGD